MNEFGATLQSFIELAGFPTQADFAKAADLQAPNVTRAIKGEAFSEALLAKLIAPFPAKQRVELVRTYMRVRLGEEGVPADIIAAVFQESEVIKGLRGDLRLLAERVISAAKEDPAFQRTLEDLLELIDTDARSRRLYLVAEPKAKKPHFTRGALPRGDSQTSAG